MHSSNSVPVASLSYNLLIDTQDVAAESLLTGGSDNTTASGCQISTISAHLQDCLSEHA